MVNQSDIAVHPRSVHHHQQVHRFAAVAAHRLQIDGLKGITGKLRFGRGRRRVFQVQGISGNIGLYIAHQVTAFQQVFNLCFVQ